MHKASPSAYPNGCHVAEVEVDPETGVVQVVRYTMTNDFGTVVNPMIVAGQAHGGVLQGIGQALMERVDFDSDGQLLTGSFSITPCRAPPRRRFRDSQSPDAAPPPIRSAPKAAAKRAAPARLPSVMNALVDALKPFGVTHVNMPATPEVVWRLIHDAR